MFLKKKVSINEVGKNPLYCVNIPCFIWLCGMNHTGINLQTLQDRDLVLLLEIIVRGGISSVLGDKYVKSDAKKKIYT